MTASTPSLEAASERAAREGFHWKDAGLRSLARGERPRPTILIQHPGEGLFPYSGSTTADALNRALDAEVKLRDELRALDGCKVCGGGGTYIANTGERVLCRHGRAA